MGGLGAEPSGPLANSIPVMETSAISEENRKVFICVAELLDPARRENALMELSKKREQVPELALVIWHSFGMVTLFHFRERDMNFRFRRLIDTVLLFFQCHRSHDRFITGNNLRISPFEPITIDRCCFEPSLQCLGSPAVCRIAQ